MNSYQSRELAKEKWIMSNPTVIDYNHQRSSPAATQENRSVPVWNKTVTQNQNLAQSVHNAIIPVELCKPVTPTQDTIPFKQLYSPFAEANVADMEISDDEVCPQNTNKNSTLQANVQQSIFSTIQASSVRKKLETKSGAAFYRGLILYIPSFEQISNTYRGSPAMKMLYASFEFSFKIPVKIEVKQKQNNQNMSEASVIFQDHLIAKATNTTTLAAHNEVSVKALELLSETCYTIQAKENYFVKCKMVDGSEMKTLNLKKWEAVSQKYPKIVEVTKDSHIQKTFSVFLDNHTSTGLYEDIICCNLTRQDVMHIKSVVEFFQLSMLPCCINSNMAKKNTPCIISIHKYTSAEKLLEILIESGGENDKFRLYSPDTFKDFYKLHHNYWEPALRSSDQNKIVQLKTTLEDTELQSAILKPYENVVAELFEKYKLLPKVKKQNLDSEIRRSGDDFMKDTLKIDMAHSKTVAPVERMQLLLKYMEQLQEYGSRVLTSGHTERIKIYHSAIDNLRKDLETCRKDIEKGQKDKDTVKEEKKTETHHSQKTKLSPTQRKTPPRVRSKSPRRRSNTEHSKTRSVLPSKRTRSRSPRKSMKRRSASPGRRPRSRSPRRSARIIRDSPPKKTLPVRYARSRSRSPIFSKYQEGRIVETIFKDQFRKFVQMLRRFRIEVEDTPIERRASLKDKIMKNQEQLHKFYTDVMNNKGELGGYVDEIMICQDEIDEQVRMVVGKPVPHNLPRNPTHPPWMNVRSFEPTPQYSSFSLPIPPQSQSHPALFQVAGAGAFSTSYPLPNLPPRYSSN